MGVYVVTGTRTGIGLEYVRQLGRSQANTVVAIVRKQQGSDLSALRAVRDASEGAVHIVECDVSSETSVAGLAASIEAAIGAGTRVDVLINNAAVLHAREQTSLTATPEAIASHVNTNVVGPARVLQVLLPLLAPAAAVVANISSGLGSLNKLSDGRIPAVITPYSISKAALNMLTVHQAKHLADRAIVVAIDPGHVKTEMGGPEAVLEIEDSAKGVLGVLGGLKQEDTGKFLLYNGTELEW
ncbi:NAD(P)-binding protein [Sodiomyces alkalinus F11]|uniref:NAD(P)-binding protein n=1 Tax=Sodiomyces alkalinus (strain CBS 110278 / VKM F-3762 / F11) TaxID=1314773 RepID=A0A3N2PLB0_SODAK|nr:NAD(P)-binding protein [Sodiomyces alkalinus F11]ROT35279.1 NAD(P)-binding protein [Sodiomyces alkalinus F11]